MHKVQALERMFLLNTSKHMNAALFASITLDHSGLINDMNLALTGLDLDLVRWDSSNDREECAFRFPALGAAAGVVVGDIASELNLHWIGGAFADECAAVEVLVAWLDAVVN